MSHVREAARRQERLEGENRQLKADLARHCRAVLNGGALTRLVRLYDDLSLQADPVKGRPVETSAAQHPFDRPVPYLSTQTARAQLHVVDRALHRVADWIDRQMDESEASPRDDACPACGSRVDRQGRPPNRRRLARLFLEKNLQGAPVRQEHVLYAAQTVGVAASTLRRAADELGVVRFEEDGERWWRLP
jgi:hypothetical protein